MCYVVSVSYINLSLLSFEQKNWKMQSQSFSSSSSSSLKKGTKITNLSILLQEKSKSMEHQNATKCKCQRCQWPIEFFLKIQLQNFSSSSSLKEETKITNLRILLPEKCKSIEHQNANAKNLNGPSNSLWVRCLPVLRY